MAMAEKPYKKFVTSAGRAHRKHYHHHHHTDIVTKAVKAQATKASRIDISTKLKKVAKGGKKAHEAPTKKPKTTHKASGASISKSTTSSGINGLALHNSFRAKYGAPAMTWDATIAAGAQAYAETCASGHSGVSGLGENLAWGTATLDQGIQLWLDEAADYNYNQPGFSSATGHFTQVVWKSSTKLGCGFAKCSTGPYPTMTVCRYSPEGNILNAGYFEANVGKPV